MAQVGHRIGRFARGSLRVQVALLFVIAGGLSMFINNTAAIAMFIPIAIQIAKQTRRSPSRLLLPLNYAVIVGGTCTLVGTSTNILVSSLAAERGIRPFSMFEFARMGLVYFALGLAYNFLLVRFLPDRGDPSNLTGKYELATYLTEVRVPATSPLVGRTVVEETISDRYHLNVLEIPGGGSALLARPTRGIGLEDLEALNRELQACGASIGEVNALRKHLSAVAGGRLGVEAWPARVVALVLSDVVGDRLDVIGSCPFAADPTTFAECSAIIGRYALRGRLPPAVLRAVESGERGERPETVKPGDGRLDRVRHVVVGSNRLSLDAAARRARDLGYAPMVLSSMLEGEARQAAKFLAPVAKECGCSGTLLPPPACLLAGGETTVTLGSWDSFTLTSP